MIQGVIEQQNLDQWHALRSRLIDAFAEFEGAIVAQLKLANVGKLNNEPLSQKIEMLKAAKPSPQYSKAKRDQVQTLSSQFDRLVEVRSDVVHARLQLSNIDGMAAAVFLNARELNELAPKVRVVTMEHFRQLEKDARKLSATLTKKPEAGGASEIIG